jgi:hypothetical protein
MEVVPSARVVPDASAKASVEVDPDRDKTDWLQDDQPRARTDTTAGPSSRGGGGVHTTPRRVSTVVSKGTAPNIESPTYPTQPAQPGQVQGETQTYVIEFPRNKNGESVVPCNVPQVCTPCPLTKESVLGGGHAAHTTSTSATNTPGNHGSHITMFRETVYDRSRESSRRSEIGSQWASTGSASSSSSSRWGLRFDSNFENGNLERADWVRNPYAPATSVDTEEYDLYLSPDPVMTGQDTQSGDALWFHFHVSNIRKQRKYRFHVKNCTKARTLHHTHVIEDRLGPKKMCGAGVCVLTDSVQGGSAAPASAPAWIREGTDVSYIANSVAEGERRTYTLSFTLEFAEDYVSAYVAYALPYTYTHLQNFLYRMVDRQNKRVQAGHDGKGFLRVQTLCRSKQGNKCEILTISEDLEEYLTPPELRQRLAELTKSQQSKAPASRPSRSSTSRTTRPHTRDGGPKTSDGKVVIAEEETHDSNADGLNYIPPALLRISRELENDELQRLKATLQQIRSEFSLDRRHAKPTIVMCARIHAGSCSVCDRESRTYYQCMVVVGDGSSSFVMEGIIRFLLSSDPIAAHLRRQFVFHVVPMVNVDGVVSIFSDGDKIVTEVSRVCDFVFWLGQR